MIFGKYVLLAGVAAFGIGSAVPAHADFDYCSRPEAQLASARANWDAQKAAAEAEIPTAMPDAKFETEWWRVQKDAQHKKYMTDNPWLDKPGIDKEAVFEAWFTNWRAKMAEQAKKQIVADYRTARKAKLEQDKAEGDKAVAEQRAELDGKCKKDVASQVTRVTLGAIVAPLEMTGRNLEVAKNESGFGAKILGASTGISWSAIEANGGLLGGGLSGGENSFFRKNLGIRF